MAEAAKNDDQSNPPRRWRHAWWYRWGNAALHTVVPDKFRILLFEETRGMKQWKYIVSIVSILVGGWYLHGCHVDAVRAEHFVEREKWIVHSNEMQTANFAQSNQMALVIQRQDQEINRYKIVDMAASRMFPGLTNQDHQLKEFFAQVSNTVAKAVPKRFVLSKEKIATLTKVFREAKASFPGLNVGVSYATGGDSQFVCYQLSDALAQAGLPNEVIAGVYNKPISLEIQANSEFVAQMTPEIQAAIVELAGAFQMKPAVAVYPDRTIGLQIVIGSIP